MVYHSFANASISTVGSNMEFVKKKWCKLDVRREQWLSQENDSLINCYYDCESPSNSFVGHTSSLDSNISVGSFTGSGDSGGCYSGSMTEEDDGDDGCLDDWETIADGLVMVPISLSKLRF
ncbi:putative CCR4-NOT transcription complex subunit 4 [Helianthus anomalus]